MVVRITQFSFFLFLSGPYCSVYARSARQMDPSEREKQNGSIRLRRLAAAYIFLYKFNPSRARAFC